MKFIPYFFYGLLVSLLTACSKPSTEYTSFSELQSDLFVLNNLLLVKTNYKSQLPFNEAYLKSRNDTLLAGLSLSGQHISTEQRSELELLVIEQRAATRFFAWPTGSSPVINALHHGGYSIDEIAGWVSYVQKRLVIAEHDKLLLNKYQLNALKNEVATTLQTKQKNSELSKSLTELQAYLNTYTPRRLSGLLAIANGKELYQARLNYFTNATHAPEKLLDALSTMKATNEGNKYFLTCYLASNCTNSLGLDWRTQYSNRLLEYKMVNFSEVQRLIALVDLGIHYQGWRDEHALKVLENSDLLTKAQQQAVLERVLVEPGLALVNFSL